MGLIERDVEKACRANYERYAHNCSGFVRAVANDLMILVPGMSFEADDQIFFSRLVSTPFFWSLGSGRAGELNAVAAAAQGHFVLCGLTSAELQKNRPGKNVRHGHVAIVSDGWAADGWPLAYWGSLGGKGGKRESLANSFRLSDRPMISYFAYLVR